MLVLNLFHCVKVWGGGGGGVILNVTMTLYAPKNGLEMPPVVRGFHCTHTDNI